MYKILIVLLSLRWVFSLKIFDYVKYQDEIFTVLNMNFPDGMICLFFDNYGNQIVSRKECKKIYSMEGMISSFKRGYDFYMSNWYKIWKREGIKDWVKVLNI